MRTLATTLAVATVPTLPAAAKSDVVEDGTMKIDIGEHGRKTVVPHAASGWPNRIRTMSSAQYRELTEILKRTVC